jgi:hypothetical protein
MLRGINGATAEMSLVLLVHDLRKCLNKALFSAFSTRIDAAFEPLSWHDFITCPWSNGRRVSCFWDSFSVPRSYTHIRNTSRRRWINAGIFEFFREKGFPKEQMT